MLDNLIFSVNTVLPLCFFVLLGVFLRNKKMFTQEFFSGVDKFVFKLALPCMIFLDVLECDVSQLTDVSLISFVVIGITLSVAVLYVTVPLFVKEKARQGAFIQGVYRSNFAVLGVSLAGGLAGDDGLAAIAVAMPFTIVLFNAYAVVTLSVFTERENRQSAKAVVLTVLKDIISNPLIIATATALIFMMIRENFGFELPTAALSIAERLADTVYAMAMISLGASMTKESFGDGKLKTAIVAAALKTVVLPAVAVTVAALLGFTGARICVVFVLFGAPSAISSYIMAKNMKSDAELAGQILLVSTIMSLGTIFAGVFILKTIGLI